MDSIISIKSLIGLSDVTITVTEDIAGYTSLLVNGTPVDDDGVEANPISNKVSSEDLDSLLKAKIGITGLADAHTLEGVISLTNLARIVVNTTDYNPAADNLDGSVSFKATDTTVTLDRVTFTINATDAITSGSMLQGSFIQNDNRQNTAKIVAGSFVPIWNISTGATTSANDGVSFNKDADGEFTYNDATVVSAGDWVYLDEESELTMNFTENTGTYSSSKFDSDGGEGADAADELTNIVITGDLQLNNTTGAITSKTRQVVSTKTGGSDTVTSSIDINAFMTLDQSAVAGAFTVDHSTTRPESSTQEVDAGVFGFIK